MEFQKQPQTSGLTNPEDSVTWPDELCIQNENHVPDGEKKKAEKNREPLKKFWPRKLGEFFSVGNENLEKGKKFKFILNTLTHLKSVSCLSVCFT